MSFLCQWCQTAPLLLCTNAARIVISRLPVYIGPTLAHGIDKKCTHVPWLVMLQVTDSELAKFWRDYHCISSQLGPPKSITFSPPRTRTYSSFGRGEMYTNTRVFTRTYGMTWEDQTRWFNRLKNHDLHCLVLRATWKNVIVDLEPALAARWV